MSKVKKFGIGQDIDRGITQMMRTVDNIDSIRFGIISLTEIEPDPDNPRELLISSKDIFNEISLDDPDFKRKKQELTELENLATTIKKEEIGVINPVDVYKFGEKYRLIAGERRFLASILAGRTDIPTKIFTKKPAPITIRLLQWIENNERSDPPLKDRLKNLEQIISEFKKQKVEKITAEILGRLTGISTAQAAHYLAVIRAPEDLREYIGQNKINNLEKASLIAGVDDIGLRRILMVGCAEGLSLNELKKRLAQAKVKNRENISNIQGKKGKGRAHTQVDLGKTKDIYIVKKIIEAVIAHQKYQHFQDQFNEINWTRYDSVTEAFKKLITILSEVKE